MSVNQANNLEETACMVPEEISGQRLKDLDETHAVSSSSLKSAISNFHFSIPEADLDLFSQLPDDVRDDVRQKLIAFRSIHRAPSAASEIRRLALALGLSASRLRNLWFDYKRAGGDWKTLVNRAKAGASWWQTKRPCLPRDFIQFWKTLCEENQRCDAAAYNELKHIYRTGLTTAGKPRSIPGYSSEASTERGLPPERSFRSLAPRPSPLAPQVNPFTGLPCGWSYENLTRYSPSKFEKAAMRQGRFAASNFRRKVFTTRVGIAVGEVIMFDDQEYDLKVNFFGHSTLSQRKAMRPLGFNALDLRSACNFSYAFKPTLIDDETQRKQKLRETEFREFITSVFLGTGYNPVTGTTLVVEHGTAAISDDLESLLSELSGGKISVSRSGIFGAPSTASQFEGQSRGNPRFKAPLESFFNLVRNRFAALPGQTGLSRDRCPDELAGRDAYNTALLKAIEQDASLAAKLHLPFYEWNEFVQLATTLYTLINHRTDHDLEGWAKCGHFAREWRLSPTAPWLPMTEFEGLPVPQKMSLSELFASAAGAALTRCRPLSPQEVFNIGAHTLQPLNISAAPMLLGEKNATERRVIRGYITLEDQSLSGDPMRFPAALDLAERETYLCYGPLLLGGTSSASPTTPASPTTASAKLVVCDSRNRYLCALDQQLTPTRTDLDAIERQMSAAKAEESALLAPIRARHAAAAREKTRMHQHNADVLAGRPSTPEERADATERREFLRNVDLDQDAREAALDPNPAQAPVTEEEQYSADQFAALFKSAALTPETND